jgi:2,3-bisphosphoglycerate-dependent phosphoglycerate mutase
MTKDQNIRIFLIRHGESEANLDKSINRRIADHRVSLSVHGHEQAASAGRFLSDYLTRHPGSGRFRLWLSPYLRTKQTARAVIDAIPHLITDTRESIFLREIEFGIFDGVPDLELHKLFPHEYAHYQNAKRSMARFMQECRAANRASTSAKGCINSLEQSSAMPGATESMTSLSCPTASQYAASP